MGGPPQDGIKKYQGTSKVFHTEGWHFLINNRVVQINQPLMVDINVKYRKTLGCLEERFGAALLPLPR